MSYINLQLSNNTSKNNSEIKNQSIKPLFAFKKAAHSFVQKISDAETEANLANLSMKIPQGVIELYYMHVLENEVLSAEGKPLISLMTTGFKNLRPREKKALLIELVKKRSNETNGKIDTILTGIDEDIPINLNLKKIESEECSHWDNDNMSMTVFDLISKKDENELEIPATPKMVPRSKAFERCKSFKLKPSTFATAAQTEATQEGNCGLARRNSLFVATKDTLEITTTPTIPVAEKEVQSPFMALFTEVSDKLKFQLLPSSQTSLGDNTKKNKDVAKNVMSLILMNPKVKEAMEKPLGRDIFMRTEANKKIATKKDLKDYRRIESVGEILAKNFILNREECKTNYWSDNYCKTNPGSQKNFKVRKCSISRSRDITPFTKFTENNTTAYQKTINLIEEESLSSDDDSVNEPEESTIFLLSPKNMSTCPNEKTSVKKNPISVFSRKRMSPSQGRLPTIDKKPEEEISLKGNRSAFMGFSVKNDIKSNFFHDRTFSVSRYNGNIFNKPCLPKSKPYFDTKTVKSQNFLPATAFKISQNFEPSKLPKISDNDNT